MHYLDILQQRFDVGGQASKIPWPGEVCFPSVFRLHKNIWCLIGPNPAVLEPEALTPQTFSPVPACLSELELVNHQGLTCSLGQLVLLPPPDSRSSASARMMSEHALVS